MCYLNSLKICRLMLSSINSCIDFAFLWFSFLRRCPVLCCVCVCQAFIKQPKEGVSFPRTRCQLFPISPAPWKRLQEPLSLSLRDGGCWGTGCVWEWGSRVPGLDPVCSLQATNEHPKEPFRIGLHFKPVSSLYINTREKEREKGERKVTSAVLLAANVECTALGIFWEQEPLWMENRGGEESLQSSSGLLAKSVW